MATTFKNWFFKQFPGKYQESDPLKNLDGEGLFQRYLQSMGNELDEDFIPYLDDFLKIVDVIQCDDKFLPLLSGILGFPPTINNLPETYRRVLAYAIAIYKIKGTKRSYEMVFNLVGQTIHFFEETPTREIFYDDFPEREYDHDGDDTDDEVYDTECQTCSGYYIHIIPSITPNIQVYMSNILCWLQPINAKFLGFTIIPSMISEELDVELSEEVYLTSDGGPDIPLYP